MNEHSKETLRIRAMSIGGEEPFLAGSRLDRFESTRRTWIRRHANNIWRVAIVLLFLLLAIWALTLSHFDLLIAYSEPWLWLTDALIQVGPELAGIVIGVVTIDYLNERRQTEQLKAQLIRQMGMNIKEVAVPAARELAHYGWLFDDSLSGVSLEEANLSGAKLLGANLSGADLVLANLSDADLMLANLSGASLLGVNLSGTNLRGANLSGADFLEAKLSGAVLRGANLSGARLLQADLSGVNLMETNLSDANLMLANLSGAYLLLANLSGAYLGGVNLSGVEKWTIKQLEQAETLEAAIMPDKVELGGVRPGKIIRGPTFEEWRAQFLAKSENEKALAGWDYAEDTEPTEDA